MNHIHQLYHTLISGKNHLLANLTSKFILLILYKMFNLIQSIISKPKYNLQILNYQMLDQQVLYGGLGTQTELKKRMTGKAIAKSHDLNGQLLGELMDAIQTGIESYASMPNMAELATKSIKEFLDKRYGPAWQCVIGEGFAYDISVQSGAYLLMYYNGNLGCLIFKT